MDQPSSSSPKRSSIRFITLATETWGAENTLLTLAGELRHSYPQYDLHLYAPEGALTREWQAQRLGKVKAMPRWFGGELTHSRILLSQVLLVPLLIVQPRVDVIHSHHQWTHLPAAIAHRNSKVVLDLHDFVPTRSGRLVQGVAATLANRIYLASARMANQLPTVARASAFALNRPVQIDVPPTTHDSRRVDQTRLTLMIACRPDPNKEIGTALTQLTPHLRGGDRVLVAGGTAVDYGLEDTPLNGHPKIDFMGPVDRTTMGDLWCSVDVHILPSPREPFGRVVVEAAAFDVPSILLSSAGTASVVREHDAGIVLDSWRDLDSALDMLRHPDRKLGFSNGLKNLVLSCSPSQIASRYVEKFPDA
ncbi:glycosyltransferase family 4 protein [Arthrobacter crystallopoietes]|uniref:glycosyltransferase family 4 protein n=1 Tax=Crystallibacter crystallopoietes TaxID=37928 RepID=UPI003D2578B7